MFLFRLDLNKTEMSQVMECILIEILLEYNPYFQEQKKTHNIKS